MAHFGEKLGAAKGQPASKERKKYKKNEQHVVDKFH